jgi:hypothetical protein
MRAVIVRMVSFQQNVCIAEAKTTHRAIAHTKYQAGTFHGQSTA